MRFNWYPLSVLIPASGTKDVLVPNEDRAFRELTIYGRPITARTSGDRTPGAPGIVNVTGVTFIAFSLDTVTTAGAAPTGTLSYTANPRRLSWQAPGSQAPGEAVGIVGAAQQLVVLKGGDGSTLTVNVNPALLPAANASDTFPVTLTVAAAQVRSFSSQVFFGPTSQGAALARVTDEQYLIYDPGDTVRIWPPNEPSSNPQRRGTKWEVKGFPITVRIVNSDAVNALGITVEVSSMTIDQG
jgi:hypothetical protein